MLTLEKTATRYRIEIEVEEMQAILCYDEACGVERETGPTLCYKLSELPGVYKVDYNGHFGPAVFLTIDEESDRPRIHGQIKAIIRKHIKVCQKVKSHGK
jgi:hypothetical protein